MQFFADGAHHQLMTSAELKKKPRGSFDYRSDGTVHAAKWNDNAITGMAGNCLTHEPIQSVTRRVKGVSNTIAQQPYIVKQYNDLSISWVVLISSINCCHPTDP